MCVSRSLDFLYIGAVVKIVRADHSALAVRTRVADDVTSRGGQPTRPGSTALSAHRTAAIEITGRAQRSYRERRATIR